MATQILPASKGSDSQTMAGSFPTEATTQQVDGRIVATLQTSPSAYTKPYSIHSNELLQRIIEPERVVATSFRTFGLLIQRLKHHKLSAEVAPSLRIPLVSSENLLAPPVSVEKFVEELSYQPPSFYILTRAERRGLLPLEQYTCPIDADYFTKDSSVYVYYNTVRSLEDIKHGWEYGRDISAKHYTQHKQHGLGRG